MKVTETGDVWVSLFSFETQTHELYYLLAGSTTWERDNSATGTVWLTASQNGDLWAVRKGSKWGIFYLPTGTFVWQKLNWESNRDIESLAISPDGNMLYLGVREQGVVKLLLNTYDIYLPVICRN